jgi:2-C-methyl-D-erythritol 2,4-cyclodiphosphate synthase
MVRNIAEDLHIAENQINIKATTEEKLGFTGEGLGMSCHAVCLLL